MKKSFRLMGFTITLLLYIVSLGAYAQADAVVHVIELNGEITPAMSAYISKEIDYANISDANGIIIEITTLGGRVDSAVEIRDAILRSGVPVVAFVKKRAVSAGALITIAAEKIFMAPGSHMGDAEPIPLTDKNLAYVSAEFRSTAKERGRDARIAAGMVDKSLDIPGFPPGKLVDLTAGEALEAGYADAVCGSVDDILDFMGWSGAHVKEIEPDFKTSAVQFLTRYDVASILITVGMIAVVIELFTQGFGLAGFIGILAFALYFGGGILAGTTDYWPVFLFVLGIVLMLIEAAVPGFGIFGIAGIVSFIVAIIFAAPTPEQGLISLGISLLLTVVAVPILYKLLGGPRLFSRLVLSESVTTDKGFVATGGYDHLLGKTGEAVTPLRPSGTAVIDGIRVDVVADGVFLTQGTRIKVIRVEGNRIVVTGTSE
ncbi:MAG TPA: NfeD family protein [Candidatus Atribacteria bacterium]|nr:NfeD family protein [Candidatus Atribacteria bacterium]HPT78862.1 NfeD family protein [Candidatus Atribacteria bacterium]